jgi:hypothetical protein
MQDGQGHLPQKLFRQLIFPFGSTLINRSSTGSNHRNKHNKRKEGLVCGNSDVPAAM